MNCEALEKHLNEFLEDSLEEPARVKAQAHLENCSACRAASMARPSFASDLKRLGSLEPPARLVTFLTRRAKDASARKKIEPALRIAFPSAAAGLVLALVIVWTAPKFGQWLRVTFADTPVQIEPEALKQLKAIARRLGADSEKSTEDAQRSIGRGVVLKPLHLHMLFPSEDLKNGFVGEFVQSKPDVSHRSPDFWVVSLNHDQLVNMLQILKKRKIKTDGVLLADSSLFPEFDGMIRVSFFLNEPADPASLSLFQHWHLTFHLPNQYALLERFQGLKIKLVYQTTEIWVFDVPGSELKKMMQTAKDFAGIKFDFGREAVLPDTDDVKTQVVIYLKDA